MKQLLKNATADDAGTDAVLIGDLMSKTDHGNGQSLAVTFLASQTTWNGETAKVQFAPTSSGPWVDATDGSFTASGVLVTPISPEFYVRAVLSGTSSSTVGVSLYAG